MPPVTGVWRALAILRGASGLPQDRFVNTFHFRKGAEGSTTARDTIADRLAQFYNQGGGEFSWMPTQTNTLTRYLSNGAINEAFGLEVRVYDLDQATPRQAFSATRPLTGFTATSGLPNEVALVGSYYAQRNIPRLRGRIYVGPLNANAMATHEAGGDMGPTLDFRQTLANAMHRLAGFTTLEWVVASEAAGLASNVTAGWIDNSFDTQRRRGIGPSARTSWTSEF